MSAIYRDETFKFEDGDSSGSVDAAVELLWVEHRVTVEFDVMREPLAAEGYSAEVAITSIKLSSGLELLHALKSSAVDAIADLEDLVAGELEQYSEGREGREAEYQNDYEYQLCKE